MIRNLKVLMLAAMAVAAFGALSAVGAQAAEFHCTPVGAQTGCNLKIENDGTGKTAHQLFEITNKNGEASSITCGTIEGSGTLAKTAEIATVSVVYSGCTWGGVSVEIAMNGCKYTLSANGVASITGCGGKAMEAKIPTCTAAMGEQKAEGGISFHNLGTTPNRTVTFQLATTLTLAVTSLSGSNCGIKQEGPYVGHFTTANAIIQATEDPGTKEVDGWWA